MAQIRFRTVDRPTLVSMLTTLYECLGSGTASISHNGNTVSYSTPSQIRATISDIENALDRRDRIAAAAIPRSPLAPQYPVISRGWN